MLSLYPMSATRSSLLSFVKWGRSLCDPNGCEFLAGFGCDLDRREQSGVVLPCPYAIGDFRVQRIRVLA